MFLSCSKDYVMYIRDSRWGIMFRVLQDGCNFWGVQLSLVGDL